MPTSDKRKRQQQLLELVGAALPILPERQLVDIGGGFKASVAGRSQSGSRVAQTRANQLQREQEGADLERRRKEDRDFKRRENELDRNFRQGQALKKQEAADKKSLQALLTKEVDRKKKLELLAAEVDGNLKALGDQGLIPKSLRSVDLSDPASLTSANTQLKRQQDLTKIAASTRSRNISDNLANLTLTDRQKKQEAQAREPEITKAIIDTENIIKKNAQDPFFRLTSTQEKFIRANAGDLTAEELANQLAPPEQFQPAEEEVPETPTSGTSLFESGKKLLSDIFGSSEKLSPEQDQILKELQKLK